MASTWLPKAQLRPRSMLLLPLFGAASFLSAWLLVGAGPARADKVEWRSDYNAARKEAKAKNLPLLLDFQTGDCFWCKKLDGTTFQEAAIIDLLNRRFIPLKINAERNVGLVETLRVRSYPTLLLAGPDGKILATFEGYVDSGRLREQLHRTLSGLKQSADNEIKTQVRKQRARELLAQARDEYRTEQYLCCLERCEVLASTYADLPEAAEAYQLTQAIKNNPEWLQRACDTLSDRLSTFYLLMAETWTRKGQSQQAAAYLERVIRSFPGTPQAATAQSLLADLQGRPALQTSFTTDKTAKP